ncbi:MAG TPA: phosphatidylserine/phosphatidylglycerophosphate/cardiolipin synthase family protein [Patescibacteria group bacterium]
MPSLREKHPFFYFPSGEKREKIQNGHRYEIVPTAEEFYSRLAEDINQTQSGQSVFLEFFTFEEDKITQPIFTALTNAATRGVKVKLLIDHWSSNPLNLINSYRAFQKFRRQARLSGDEIEVKTAGKDKELKDILKRDHKKMAVITGARQDEATAYFGGINIAGRNTKWDHFMVRVKGETAQFIAEDFQKTWDGKNIFPYKKIVKDGSTLFFDTRESETVLKDVVENIKNAKSRIWMQTSYFDYGIVRQALINAKKQSPNLDVQIFIPHETTNNVPQYILFTNRLLKPFINSDIKIFKDRGRLYDTFLTYFNHSKALIIDNKAYCGSFNFTTDPLVGGNSEIVFKTADSEFIKSLEGWFDDTRRFSKEYKGRR